MYNARNNTSKLDYMYEYIYWSWYIQDVEEQYAINNKFDLSKREQLIYFNNVGSYSIKYVITFITNEGNGYIKDDLIVNVKTFKY